MLHCLRTLSKPSNVIMWLQQLKVIDTTMTGFVTWSPFLPQQLAIH